MEVGNDIDSIGVFEQARGDPVIRKASRRVGYWVSAPRVEVRAKAGWLGPRCHGSLTAQPPELLCVDNGCAVGGRAALATAVQFAAAMQGVAGEENESCPDHAFGETCCSAEPKHAVMTTQSDGCKNEGEVDAPGEKVPSRGSSLAQTS